MFKIGDRVKKISDAADSYKVPNGFKGTVVMNCGELISVQWDIDIDGHTCSGRCPDRYGWNINKNCLQLISSCETISEKKTIMSSIKEFAKNLILSADEKLLRKQGLKDSCGNWTCEAKDIAIDMLCNDKEKELIDIATKKELEETKK